MDLGLGIGLHSPAARKRFAAAGPDSTPDAFSFTDVTDALPSTQHTSNTIAVAGINEAADISIVGGTYSKNGGAFTAVAGTVVNGDTVAVRVTSSAAANTAVDVVLTIGGVSDTYTVTTIAAPAITSTNTASVAENAVLAKALTADQSVNWSIVGGADQAELEISGSTLRWAANGVKDFEAPDDADANNTYVVTVRATNATSGFTADQTITVTVTDEVESELWEPEDLGAKLIRRWNAEDPAVGAITTWTDTVAADAAVGTGTKSATGFDGTRPEVTFNGTSDVFLFSSMTGIPVGSTPGTIFGIVRANDTGAIGWAAVYGNATGTSRGIAKNASDASRVSDRTTHAETGILLGAHTLYGHFDAATTITNILDGGTPVTATSATRNTDSTRGRLGAHAGVTAAQFFSGGINCLIITTDLTTEERDKLIGWGHWRAGLVALLPVDHPYKDAAPTTAGGGSSTTLTDADGNILTDADDEILFAEAA